MASGDDVDLITDLNDYPIDEYAEHSFVMPSDGDKKFRIPKTWMRLSGFLSDLAIASEEIPMNDFKLVDFELLKKVLDEVRATNPTVFLGALNGQPAVPFETPSCIEKDGDNDLWIRATNLSDFMSMPLARQAMINFWTDYIRRHDNEEIVKAMNGTPLALGDLDEYDLMDEEALWRSFPDVYERVYGKKLRTQ